jgi:hypothetical protein
MPLKSDNKYNGVVSPGSTLTESQTGTLSFQVMLECEDGDTYFPIWLTDKNREKALKYFEILGADVNKLNNSTYLEYELGNAITGKEVSFGTREETYKGKVSIKVAWIGKKSDPNLARGAAKFFGGVGDATTSRPVTSEDPIGDSDIPF